MALINETIVGFVALQLIDENSRLLAGSLRVAKPFNNKGIGRQIWAFGAQHIKSRFPTVEKLIMMVSSTDHKIYNMLSARGKCVTLKQLMRQIIMCDGKNWQQDNLGNAIETDDMYEHLEYDQSEFY